MRTLDSVIIGIAITGGIWSASALFGTITNNSQQTLVLRFSHGLLNVFTTIPLLVVVLGSIVLFLAFKERRIRSRQVTSRLILIGSVIIFLGFGLFSFYLID